MAGFAAGFLSVGPDLLHAFLELTLVDVVVATGAVEFFPVEDSGRLGLEFL